MDTLTEDELVRLPPPERLLLISRLWDSLDGDELPLSTAQREELDRRLETISQDRHEGMPWETLRAELEEHLQ